MLIDFDTQKEELESMRNQIVKRCDELNEYAGENWNHQLEEIQKDFVAFQNSFNDFNEQIPDLDASVQGDAQKLYVKMNNDIHNLETRINNLKKVGGPAVKESENSYEDHQKSPLSSSADFHQDLNDLEAGKETNEVEQKIDFASCNSIKKTLLVSSVIFIILGIICLIIFLSL